MDPEDLEGTNEASSPAERAFMQALAGLQQVTDPADTLEEVAPEVAYMRLLIVNVCFVGPPQGAWTLVDAGLPGSARGIIEGARRRFGSDRPPSSIIITHGHFDHVGALTDLLQRWDVPVYAHVSEIPFLTGKANYVEPDPSVDPGLMARVAPLYPNEAINLGDRVQPLPVDGSVPGMPGWRWVATPGHTTGHIALFREADRVLIIGDAFTTVKQESARDVLLQKPEIHGPPKYFTPDWDSARESVRQLEALHPSVIIPSHGRSLRGDALARQLAYLAEHFDEIAIPEHRRRAA